LLSKTYIGLTHPQDLRRDLSELARMLRGKADSWSSEKRCVRKDGSVVWLGVNGAVLRDGTGRAVRILAMISDRTASKQAEQERRDAESSAKKGKPMRLKKVAVKKSRESVSTKSSDKPRLKKR
jgi:PAS domain-containing protein